MSVFRELPLRVYVTCRIVLVCTRVEDPRPLHSIIITIIETLYVHVLDRGGSHQYLLSGHEVMTTCQMTSSED